MRYFLLILAVVVVGCKGEESTPIKPPAPKQHFMKGTTMSFVSYLEDQGKVYREGGRPFDPYLSLRHHGANIVRLQYDLEPFAPMGGKPIDWQSLDRVQRDAKRASDAKLDLCLTIKPDRNIYSEGATLVNRLPTCWQSIGEDLPMLCQALRDMVVQTLGSLPVAPRVVAVGNEINLGFLELEGKPWDAARIARLLEAGCYAAKLHNTTHSSQTLVAVHIASPHNIDGVLPLLIEKGLKSFDVVAVSWYEGMEGHSMGGYGSFVELAQSVMEKYGRPLLVLETAASFTNGGGDERTNAYYNPVWSSDEEQFSQLEQRTRLSNLARDVKAGGGIGLITWGSEALPGDSIWYYPAPWGSGSTWENNSYWDYNNDNNLHMGINWMQDVD